MKSHFSKRWNPPVANAHHNTIIECGWGRLLFAQTFTCHKTLAEVLQQERDGQRDVAFHVSDPQVVLAHAPQELFIDPSYTYRLILNLYPIEEDAEPENFLIRPLSCESDSEAVNAIYRQRQMVTVNENFLTRIHHLPFMDYWVAEDRTNGAIIGVAMSLDHKLAFDDPENGSSVWSVAVDAQTLHSSVGLSLMRHISRVCRQRGRSFLDLSVMHDNTQAIALYEQMGFQKVATFSLKKRNAVNEPLFCGKDPTEALNPYARIITREALRRGIKVEVVDEAANYFKLTHGGRSILCRESLSELTSAVAMSRCADKEITHRTLTAAGLAMPRQQVAGSTAENVAFLKTHAPLVVKPADGEQGAGITMNIRNRHELTEAIAKAASGGRKVILEEMIEGEDLRILVIGFEVVAAAIRRPPMVQGTGRHSIQDLIRKQSRRRMQATGGESRIPIDDELRRTVTAAGYQLEDILPEGERLIVRKTANLHTGGTMHDVTDRLHPALAEVARQAARALDIPVTGLDMIVPDPEGADYVIIETNERPGLANHEPQSTAERFIDFLFPQTKAPV